MNLLLIICSSKISFAPKKGVRVYINGAYYEVHDKRGCKQMKARIKISGCGFFCGDCVLLHDEICSGCSIGNEIAKDCNIIKCLKKMKLTTCLKCNKRYIDGKICSIYKIGLRHCPIRICLWYIR